MFLLTHSNFQFDLVDYKLSIQEENFWFSDSFFAKFTFPVTFMLTDELNKAFGDIKSYTSLEAETYFSCKVHHNGEESDAIMEIEEINGEEVTANVRYGLDELPNAQTKLSQLPLEYLDLEETTIYDHAETIIGQTFPTVNYNFVMAHVDKFSIEEEQWQYFEGLINKRVAGDFVENEYDDIEDEQVNRNVMQPQPYLLHVLQKGFEDAGFTLAGDILNDTALKKAVISEISDYYSTVTAVSQELTFNQTEFDTEEINGADGPFFNPTPIWYGEFDQQIVLPEAGRYKIAGNLNLRKKSGSLVYIRVRFNGNIIWQKVKTFFNSGNNYYQINKNINFYSGSGVVKVESYQLSRFTDVSSDNLEDFKIADLTITQLAKFDGSGNPMPTLLSPSEIKLTECVPDMTFGDLVTAVRTWKNLDVTRQGNTIYMNYINTQLAPSNVVDLSQFEVRFPKRLYNKGNSFELRFKTENTDEYTFDKLFIDVNGVLVNEYIKNDDTQEISINGLPLPVISKNEITTAHHFTDDKSTLKLILYDGTAASTNVAEPIDTLQLPEILDSDYNTWLNLRINGKSLNWNFAMTDEQLSKLKINSKVFAYSQNHILKRLNKDAIGKGFWQVEVETLSLVD